MCVFLNDLCTSLGTYADGTLEWDDNATIATDFSSLGTNSRFISNMPTEVTMMDKKISNEQVIKSKLFSSPKKPKKKRHGSDSEDSWNSDEEREYAQGNAY